MVSEQFKETHDSYFLLKIEVPLLRFLHTLPGHLARLRAGTREQDAGVVQLSSIYSFCYKT